MARRARRKRPKTAASALPPSRSPGPARYLDAPARWLDAPRALWVALGLAAALRVAHLLFNARNPEVNTPILDHQAYDVLAQRILAGTTNPHHAFWADPLYAYTLALVYALVGHSPATVRVLQLGCGLATVAFTACLARRITGSRAVGHAAAFVAALYVPAIHYEAQLEKAAFSTFLATAALVLLLHPHRRAPLAAGIVAGLAALARSNTLLLIPYGAVVLYTEASSRPDARRRAMTYALAAMAVVSVVTVRNLAASGEFVLTTSNFGQNLYIAELPANTYGVYVPPDFIRPTPEHEEDDFRAEAERRTGHAPMGPRETSSYWAGEALREVAAHPGEAVARTLHKLRLAFHSFEVPDNDDVALAAHYSPVLRLPVFWMGQLSPFALLGLVAFWRRSRDARVIAGAGALYATTLLVFFVTGRFRVPMVPVVIAFAAAGGAWLVERLREGDLGAYGARLAGAGFVGLLTLWPNGWMTAIGNHSLAVSYNNVGVVLAANHDARGAIEAYETAVRLDPEGVLGAARTLGELYLQQGDYADAERVMRLVLRYRPQSAAGRNALERLNEARHAGEGSPQSVVSAPARAGLDAAAAQAMLNHLRMAPPHAPVWIDAREGDAAAVARANELAAVFRNAGWDVRRVGATPVRVRAGLFLFLAGTEPPDYVNNAYNALDLAHLRPETNVGYRAYYDEASRTRPGFMGFHFDPDQTWLLVVGRME